MYCITGGMMKEVLPDVNQLLCDKLNVFLGVWEFGLPPPLARFVTRVHHVTVVYTDLYTPPSMYDASMGLL